VTTVGRAALAGVLATIGAGLVGVARQRNEAIRVARGELVPAGAASLFDPVRSPGAVGRRLAAWVPPPPRTRIGRIAVAIWASPLSLIGLVLAGAAGRRPRWDPRHGCLVVDAVRGPSATALRLVGAEANTVGQVVLSRHARTSPVLLAHEAVHVRQGERLGPLLFPAYLWLGARYGYRDHPLERAARLGAARSVS
jgi:hypothetical protein